MVLGALPLAPPGRHGLALAALLAPGVALAAPSPTRQLDRAWESYKARFIQEDGRVMDPKAQGITTSEGQSYALARAVWMDDPQTFDRVLRWTLDNLQGGDGGALPAWKWGRSPEGAWGVLDPQPAADADQWTAWALILASRRWERPPLLDQARALLDRIWRDEVEQGPATGGLTVMLPGPWARGGSPLRLNPSYFLFPAWRDFASVHPDGPWLRLTDDAYGLLSPALLPTDWTTLALDPPRLETPEPEQVFSFDAFRTPWNVAAHARMGGDARALALLEGWIRILEPWRVEGRIPARLSPTGGSLADYEYPGMVGALLPGWAAVHPRHGRRLYRHHLRPLWTGQGWGDPDDYFAQNQVWFGLALLEGRVVSLEDLP